MIWWSRLCLEHIFTCSSWSYIQGPKSFGVRTVTERKALLWTGELIPLISALKPPCSWRLTPSHHGQWWRSLNSSPHVQNASPSDFYYYYLHYYHIYLPHLLKVKHMIAIMTYREGLILNCSLPDLAVSGCVVVTAAYYNCKWWKANRRK
jgi:hypothetical protein